MNQCKCGGEWFKNDEYSAYEGEIVLICKSCGEYYLNAQNHFSYDELSKFNDITPKDEIKATEYEIGDIIEMFGDVRHFLVTGFITDSERLFVTYECEEEVEIKFSSVSNKWRQYK